MSDDIWKSPGTREERAAEQDQAAGGREKRVVYTGGPRGRAVASVSLRPLRGKPGVSASLRYKSERKTFTRYVGEIQASSREKALRKAWAAVHQRRLLY